MSLNFLELIIIDFISILKRKFKVKEGSDILKMNMNKLTANNLSIPTY